MNAQFRPNLLLFFLPSLLMALVVALLLFFTSQGSPTAILVYPPSPTLTLQPVVQSPSLIVENVSPAFSLGESVELRTVAPELEKPSQSHSWAQTATQLASANPSLLSVRATWYCEAGRSPCTRGYPPDCFCAAISPDLAWMTGKLVKVWFGSKYVIVRIVDCNCETERGIDLYASAFKQLEPNLSVGVLTVKLEVVR